MPIERAKMRIKVTVVTIVLPLVLERIREEVAEHVERERDEIALEIGDPVEVDEKSDFTMLIDPSVLRIVNDTLEQIAPSPQSAVDILQLACITEGQALVDQELARRATPAATTAAASNGAASRSAPAQSAQAAGPADAEETRSVSTESNSASDGRKKGNRKSKSARRREKEEAQERKERKEAEERRRKEREEKRQAKHQPVPQETSETADSLGAKMDQLSLNQRSSQAEERSTRRSCNTCGGEFLGRDAYREHFRSDWHRFNQKRKLAKMAPLCLADFEELEDPFGADAPPVPA